MFIINFTKWHLGVCLSYTSDLALLGQTSTRKQTKLKNYTTNLSRKSGHGASLLWSTFSLSTWIKFC